MIKILLLVSVTAFGQSISLTGPASAAPGSAIVISVNYTAGNAPAGLQFTVTAPVDITAITASAGTATTAASKTLVCSAFASLTVTCIVYGVNNVVIGSGQLAILSATLSTAPTLASETFTISGVLQASLSGNPIFVTVTPTVVVPVTAAPLSPCDLNGDGINGGVDVALMVNWILRLSVPTPPLHCDVNLDGACNLFDMVVINQAALGGVCTAR